MARVSEIRLGAGRIGKTTYWRSLAGLLPPQQHQDLHQSSPISFLRIISLVIYPLKSSRFSIRAPIPVIPPTSDDTLRNLAPGNIQRKSKLLLTTYHHVYSVNLRRCAYWRSPQPFRQHDTASSLPTTIANKNPNHIHTRRNNRPLPPDGDGYHTRN